MVLRVRLEIVPFGREDEAYEIGRLDIFNRGLVYGGDPVCGYGVIDLDEGEEGLFARDIFHDRREGAWALVKRVLGMKVP